MRLLIILLLVGTFLISCQKITEENLASIGTDYVGNWKILDMACNGTSATIAGMNEYLSLSESSGRAIDYGSGCYASHNNFSISTSGQSVTFSNGAITCSPTSCSIPYTVNISGGSSQNSSYTCVPSSVNSSSLPYTIDSNGYLVANDGTCYIRYSRALDIPPNASCISMDNGSMSATVTAGVSILTDNSDKAAMQFRVTSDKQLRAVKVLMESWDLSSARIQLYKGGATPESGEIIATITKTYGLHKSSATQHIFDLENSVSLLANTDYYFVFSGSGSNPSYNFDISGNTSNLIPNGQLWTKSGSVWSANAAIDLNIGYIFDTIGCN